MLKWVCWQMTRWLEKDSAWSNILNCNGFIRQSLSSLSPSPSTPTHTRVYRTSSLCQTSTPHHPCRCSVAETPWESAKTFIGYNTGLAATPLSKRPNIKQGFSHLFSTDYPANMVANSYNNSTEACTAHTLPYGPQLAKLANHNG